jgi:hypothetical protein
MGEGRREEISRNVIVREQRRFLDVQVKIAASIALSGSYQTHSRWPEEKLKARVETILERSYKLRIAMDALMDSISDLKAAKAGLKSKGK